VLPFENATGEPTLDPLGLSVANEILQELASTGLASVGLANSSGEASGGTGRQDASPSHAGYGFWTLKNAEYVITGSYSEVNGKLAYRARIHEVESGNIAIAVDTVMGSLVDPTEATERLNQRVAGALAMALDPWLSDLAGVASHPPSFEGYQILAEGLSLLERGWGFSETNEEYWAVMRAAGDAFLRAAALDSRFTLPLILKLETSWVAASDSQIDSVLKALEPSRKFLPRWERPMLDYHLARQASDFEGQYHAMHRVVGISSTPQWVFSLALAASLTNRPREALGLLEELETRGNWIERRPWYWGVLTDVKTRLGDYEGCLRDIDQANTLLGGRLGPLLVEVEALARLGRIEEATNRSIEILESTDTRDFRYSLPGIFRALGLDEQARRVAEAGVASLSQLGGANPQTMAATLVLAGRYDEARQEISRALDSGIEDYRFFAYLAYMAAREGNAEEAIQLSDRAATVASESGGRFAPAQGMMSQVEVAAHLGDLARAVRVFRKAIEQGLQYGSTFIRWDLTPLHGYQPFENLRRPKG
jgi:tetratricopeptide (TPR) repeat protein